MGTFGLCNCRQRCERVLTETTLRRSDLEREKMGAGLWAFAGAP